MKCNIQSKRTMSTGGAESSEYTEESSDNESTQLLRGNSPCEERRISTLRNQVVIILVHIFMTSVTTIYWIVLTQYLVDRLAREAGYVNISSVDHCTSNASDPSTKHANEVQEQVTNFLTNFNFVQTVPAFFACFFIGSYSDYIGRRALLLLPIFTEFLVVATISCIIRFHLDVNLLYAGFGLDGLAGSWPAIFVLEFAITSDINASKDSRTVWMFVILCSGSIVLAGVMLATSFLINTLGFFYASLLLTSMGLLNFLIAFIFLQLRTIWKQLIQSSSVFCCANVRNLKMPITYSI
ncbi:hypothetical protein RRG08_007275 [Elysia crispata]|uniref:Uncharacterized protein n=1 Tax=Elysia crispata TaxID=231223 RepID=A0AAE0ZT88_9GAST|nr:hypothetical protein RRG08_007275 [Elysia crispata]